jgi:hypothetical protein
VSRTVSSESWLRRPSALAVTPIAAFLVVAGLALSVISIGGTGDTPCGSLVDPSFDDPFNSVNLCGTVHMGTLVIVVGLVLGGCLLVVLAVLSARGRIGVWCGAWALTGMAVTSAIGWGWLAWRVSGWHDDFHRRGWTPVRNLTGFVAVAFAVALPVVMAVLAVDSKRGLTRTRTSPMTIR